MVIGLPTVSRLERICDGCVLGKQHRLPFPQVSKFRAERGLELVHADLCGQITPKSLGGASYFLLVVDDFSRFMWVELLRTKDQALECFKKIKTRAELECSSKLKGLRTDRGGEFISNLFAVFCDENGVKHYTTTPYTPQQNGVVERRNQTVVEMARCMLKAMQVPPQFWGEAVCAAVYVLNRAPTKSLNDKTPFEAWYGRKPHVSHFRVFGCTANVKIAGPNLSKLSDRSRKMVFIGYEFGTKGYRFYDPTNAKLVVSRDVIFEENQPWPWNREEGSAVQQPDTFTVEYEVPDQNPTTAGAHPEMQQPAAEEEQQAPADDQGDVGHNNTPPNTPSSQGSAPAQAHGWATPPSNQSADSDDRPVGYRYLSDLLDSTEEVHDLDYSGVCMLAADEPKNVEQALEEECWRQAMNAEMQSILQNKTWTLSELPKDHKAIGLKWVFKVKRDPAGNIVKHKARLVAKGYAQVQGIDYDEVFAPVARLETVRLLLVLAAQGEWEVHHMDVKSAFLNGELQEEVYVHQPPGFIDPKAQGKVLKLKKALYGLKQAPRAWNARLDQELYKLGFVRSMEENAVYRRGSGLSLLIVGVYVDDLIICGPNSRMIATFKEQMKRSFNMSDLGLLSYYLGLEVKQKPGEITICQSAYAEKILETSGMKGCNPVDTPMEQHLKLLPGKPELVSNATRYRSIVGSLRYLVNSRPDLSFSVGMVSRFMECPNSEHWGAIKRILRYVAGTTKLGCSLSKDQAVN